MANSSTLPIPPDLPVEGLTQAEWANEWWEYVFSIPADLNPIFDETGENVNIGQSGPIFYLAGALASEPIVEVERTIAIPTDKFIFFPLVNFQDNTFGEDPPRTEEELFASVNEVIDNVSTDSLFTLIDGDEVPDLEEQRQVSPAPFDIILPKSNLFGLPEGTIVPDVVSDGYWLMLNPLPSREEPYKINFGGIFEDPFNSLLNITYIIKTYNQILGTKKKNLLFGTKLNDEIYGLNGRDVLIGRGASDALDGGNGRDILIGVKPTSNLPGFGEIDALTGGKDRDTFVLGNAKKVYYDDGNLGTQGLSDYALITDFKNNDVIQLKGSSDDYLLVDDFKLGATTGTAIFLKEETFDELIGITEGVFGLNLNSNDFNFV